MSARYYILHEQPKLSFNLLSLGTGIFAVVSPTLIPVALHLAALLLYGPLLFNKRNVLRNSADLWIGLSLVKTLCWAAPAWNAVSNPATSLLTLFFGSAITSFITVGAVLINSALRSRVSATGSQLVLFPAIWAAGWYAVSVASPIGRLAMWAPVVDAAGYEWLLPIMGPLANDWIAAAWAVVVSEIGGYLLMGLEDPEDTPLLQIPTTSKSTSRKNTVLFMFATLVALVIPSFFITNVPLSSASPYTTPLRVGCVLPPRPAHRSLTFDDYLKETAHLWGQTDVLLWPEGAVSFDSEVARDAAFAKVAESLQKNSKALVGMSFIDTESDPADRSGKTLIRRNGVAFISRESEEPGLVYYKRNLVPFTESYSLTHSLPLPEIYTYELLVKKEKRQIPITTSICLDFASPNTFRGLDSKPALILAPASTWDRAVAQTMWQQARQRAMELGSTVLWCDGGVSGISGVAGKGMSEATQIGEGSWTRVVGVAFPFDDSRTVYGRAGNALPLAIMAAMFGLGLVGRFLGRIDFKVMNPVALINGWRRLREPSDFE